MKSRSFSLAHALPCLAGVILLCGFSPAQAAEEQLDPLLWATTASRNDKAAGRAVDGQPDTRWDSAGPQEANLQLQINMNETRPLSRIEVDATGSNGDYPRELELSVSKNGTDWKVLSVQKGKTVTELPVPAGEAFRYVKIRIPESAPLSGGFWSIHEIRAFGPSGQRALPRPPVRWRAVKTDFPTRDLVVAGYDIRDFGIDPAKGQDATEAIRLATTLLARAGGGALWLPSGRYRLSEPLILKNNVSIRGDWKKPMPGQPVQGTILEITANRGQADAVPAISLYDASAVNGITFWYPQQNPAAIVPYPFAVKQFGGVGMAVENVTFVNAYRGFACGPETTALFFLRNIYGTALETGISIDSTVDIGRMEMVRFSPNYWPGSGLPGSPTAGGVHAQWMAKNGTGLVFRRNDWSYAYDVEIDGYHIGLRTLPSLGEEDVSKNRKSYPNGNSARFRFIRCETAIAMENVSNAGFMLQDSEIVGCKVGLLAEEPFTNTLQIMNCRIADTPLAIRLLGPGRIFVTTSDIGGTVENKTGFISFAGGKTTAIARSGAAGKGQTVLLPDPGIPPVKNPYQTPTDRFAPPTTDLAVVTAFGARGDATADDTAAVQKALAAVTEKGGTVFFPGGEYRITQELEIPTGVELRGVGEAPHHAQTRGSVIDVIPGRGKVDGKPFITLSAGSGLRGLTFHYPELDATNIVPYPWMIRGAGAGVWAVNISCTMAYQMLDLATNRCDRHYIDYVAGHGLLEAFRVGGGSVGGRLINCQLNANYYAFTNSYANSPNKMSPQDHSKYMDPVYRYAKDHGRAFVIEDCQDQILFQNFVFGAREGLVLTGQQGPSGWCLGHGSDQCAKGILIDRIGPGGMPLINNQLVTVTDNGPDRAYLALSPKFKGTAYVVGLDAWGTPDAAISVQGGTLMLASTAISNAGKTLLRVEKGARASLTQTIVRTGTILAEIPANSIDDIRLNGLVTLKESEPTFFATAADIPPSRIALRIAGTSVGGAFDAALPTAGWKARANAKESETSRAFDNDPETRWTTGRPSGSGDSFELDLGQLTKLSKIRIDATASKNDYPKMMQVQLSKDGRNWSDIVYSGSGDSDLRLAFAPRQARYIRIANLSEGGGGYWSIHELSVSDR